MALPKEKWVVESLLLDRSVIFLASVSCFAALKASSSIILSMFFFSEWLNSESPWFFRVIAFSCIFLLHCPFIRDRDFLPCLHCVTGTCQTSSISQLAPRQEWHRILWCPNWTGRHCFDWFPSVLSSVVIPKHCGGRVIFKSPCNWSYHQICNKTGWSTIYNSSFIGSQFLSSQSQTLLFFLPDENLMPKHTLAPAMRISRFLFSHWIHIEAARISMNMSHVQFASTIFLLSFQTSQRSVWTTHG